MSTETTVKLVAAEGKGTIDLERSLLRVVAKEGEKVPTAAGCPRQSLIQHLIRCNSA